MNLVIVLVALFALMLIAYRGYSVILFAPLIALVAVFAVSPSEVPAMFNGIFLEKMTGFLKLYFPVFILGAVFGKTIEISGFSDALVGALLKLCGDKRVMLAIVLVCALLTYGGVSLFVVVFAVFPFADEMFRRAQIPKRLIPGTIALGAFTFTMDSLPGSPQIQNIIPTTFFHTDAWAAPWLGTFGGALIFALGMWYLESRRKAAMNRGEGYGQSEPPTQAVPARVLGRKAWLAIIPLLIVAGGNRVLLPLINAHYGSSVQVLSFHIDHPVEIPLASIASIWSLEAALLLGILSIVALAPRAVMPRFAEGSRHAVTGALIAALNTGSEYGFGAIIAALPGFILIRDAMKAIPNPLFNEAIAVTTLSGVTGSASGGMSIALAALSEQFSASAKVAGISPEVLHRVAAMASGGMDTLPHNGAVITLLVVTGLTHRESYRDIFALTCVKTVAVFAVIVLYYLTGLV